MNNHSDKLMALELVIDKLPVKDREFANSLVSQGSKKLLSDKQMYWVEVLTQRALDVVAPPETKQVGSMEGLINLFNIAKAKLKFPKLFLEVKGTPVVVSLAGERSKAPGTINVAGEGSFDYRPWYGRVAKDGTWTKGFRKYKEQEDVEVLLNALSTNPARAAKEYGKLTGRCCFCNAPLSDEKSTAAGFGPTCAKNWGLHNEWKAAQPVLENVDIA